MALATAGSLFYIGSTPSNGYVVEDSKRYAAYSAVAFCPSRCIESWNCGTTNKYPTLTNVTYISSNLTQAVGYIGYAPTTQ